MKKIFLFFGIGILSISSLLAQSPATGNQGKATSGTVPAVVDANSPIISFDKTLYDFGTIAYNSNGTFLFNFKNTGKEALVVSDVKRTCGCTSVDWTRTPVAPGASGTIKVTYNTKNVGPFTKTIIVTSNATIPTLNLQFKGVVQPAPPEVPEQSTTK